MTDFSTSFIGNNSPKVGVTPSVILDNPKYAQNVGMVQRLCSCYGVKQLWWTGERVSLDIEKRDRLPREERMKGYKDVELIQYDRPFDMFADAVPVAIEVRENSENLIQFEHPDNAIYVFGPEDGSIKSVFMQHCHRFVIIPTQHCLNLATAVATVMYDRQYKRWLEGKDTEIITPGEHELRGINQDQLSLF